MLDEIKTNTEHIVDCLGSRELAIHFLKLQQQERINEILTIEMMIATIQGVN